MSIWQECLKKLKEDLSQQQYSMWIGPLKAEETEDSLVLLAPNQFVRDWVKQKFVQNIKSTINAMNEGKDMPLFVQIDPNGHVRNLNKTGVKAGQHVSSPSVQVVPTKKEQQRVISSSSRDQSIGVTSPSIPSNSKSGREYTPKESRLNPRFTFEDYVEGRSNQLPKAAAKQVVENLGKAYNPFCICGPTGLGKTHLMHAIGHAIIQKNPNAKLVYLHAEQFVSDMVRALQENTIDQFKRFYRSVDALLIDDIQFFAGKERSQEEFFHTFNALLEAQQQVILTSDKYPKEIHGLEERLKSRFGSGLTVVVEPPELETRVAILIRKAEQCDIDLSHEVAFFIAKRIRSNVRELEGALKRVVANAQFTGNEISLDFVQNALKDLIALHDRQISIDSILNTVAEYYNIKVSDLKSKRRSRSVARPRQVAMTLAKELTNHSLPEIGEAFGGRDHTTVLHAIRTIKQLRESSIDMGEDYANLLRVLSA